MYKKECHFYMDGEQYCKKSHKQEGIIWALTMTIVILLLFIFAAISAVDRQSRELAAAYQIIASCTGHKPGAYQLIDEAGAVEDFMCSSSSTGASSLKLKKGSAE